MSFSRDNYGLVRFSCLINQVVKSGAVEFGNIVPIFQGSIGYVYNDAAKAWKLVKLRPRRSRRRPERKRVARS